MHPFSHADSRESIAATESRSHAQNFLSALQQYIDRNTPTDTDENRYSPPPIGAPQELSDAQVPSVMGVDGTEQNKLDEAAAEAMCNDIAGSLGEEAFQNQFQNPEALEAWRTHIQQAFRNRTRELRDEREEKLKKFMEKAKSSNAAHTADELYEMAMNEMRRHYKILREAETMERKLRAVGTKSRLSSPTSPPRWLQRHLQSSSTSYILFWHNVPGCTSNSRPV